VGQSREKRDSKERDQQSGSAGWSGREMRRAIGRVEQSREKRNSFRVEQSREMRRFEQGQWGRLRSEQREGGNAKGDPTSNMEQL
jgi:hypothetical protein